MAAGAGRRPEGHCGGPRDQRQDAMAQPKTRGIFYLFLNGSDLPVQDLKEHANLWDVTPIRGTPGTRLYRIQ